jgi:hypothetical protein
VPGVAAGVEVRTPPLTVMVTASVLKHEDAVEVAVNVKTVVVVRFTVAGSSIKAFISCKDGVQLYVNGPVPVTVAFSDVLVPNGIVASRPASTIGRAFTVTAVTADVAEVQPAALVTRTL